ncbi:MAG: pilus (MSHA type) biogenesis protein MshL [Candidatus Muproteobacteria bacterium RBG_16_62_13]|uniref:Pilus (MSHA type) biogenesis protein MshL n=1 Tax=Candidatus Muproteobacteria bacterium RBG_16_62_13 TaxID=1817756 RepID=A0A1F6T7B6_9PROT|nr:MAG: pilus (MSHA type) biogenesis protein MshL [Candidatus Muproteobacteria bacterium RBG_16_62_13]
MLLAALVVAGCTTPSPGWRNDAREGIDKTLDQARTSNQSVPTDVRSALLPPIEINLPQGRATPLEPRFDLAVNNAAVRQVFLGIVEGTPYSMVLHPGVGGAVTLNLKNVTVPEAMSAIRHVYGYEYRREGNRFLIYGRDMQTRLFSVNYLNVNRKGRSDTRVVSGGGQVSSGATTGATGGSPGASNVQVETLSLSDFWKDLQTTLTALVGAEGGRKVIVNPQVGVVIVRAMPEDLRLVEEFLGATHATVNRQVVLEAKIIEVELNDRFQAGINWSKISGNYTASQVGGGTADLSTTGATPVLGSLGTLRPGTGSFSPTTPGTLSNAFGGVFTLAVTASNFTAFIELLKAQGEVQVLSSPRVATVNNQKAVIKIGSDGFFATGGTAGTSTTTNSSGSAGSVTLASFFSGIALDVTPQIDEEKNILLHIHPSVSNVTQQDKTFTGLGADGKDLKLPLAFSAIQESDNVVRAQSGQIIIIGGLMKEGTTDENVSVPILGDIPILGNLFRHKKVTRVKKELIILLKPTVIEAGQDWNDALRESQDRVKKIRIGN